MPRLAAVAVSVAIVAAGCALVAGDPPWSGPRILTMSKEHGVHLGDLVVLLLTAAGLLIVWGRQRPRRAS